MRFSCDSCGAQYMISDEKVGPGGVKVRCKKCGNVVSVKRAPAVAPEIAPEPPPPAPEFRAEAGVETTLERELGNAFENAFGGGSAGLADEAKAAQASSEEAPVAEDSDGRAPSTPGNAEDVSDWYVAVDDNQVGPLQATAVKARWESGEIGPDTLAWRPGMSDWVPLSTLPEMAQYLSPVSHGGTRSVAAASPATDLSADSASPVPAPAVPVESAPGAPSTSVASAATNGAANGLDTTWKPSAASALAALANEEIASLQKPETKKEEPAPEAKSGSLLERMDLPDGGVDPTNLLPLPIKGLEPTGESALPPRPTPAPEPSDLRRAKKSSSVLAIRIAMAVFLACGVAVAIWKLLPGREGPSATVAQAPAPSPAAAPVAPSVPPPAVAEPAPAPPASASAPSTPPAAPGAAPSPPPAAPAVGVVPPAQPSAAPPAAQEPAHAAAAEREPQTPSRAHRRAKAEPPPPPPPPRTKRGGPRLATAERAPAPQPEPAQQPRRKGGGDPLLDLGGEDDVEKELSGKGSKRSVYVPPAMGSDLPENVSVSQINEAVVGQKSALMRCIEQQKAADPDTRGTLKVRWIIGGDGSTRDVRVVNDEFARQPIAPCITSIVRSIRFPRSRTTGQEVVFPFKF